MNKVKDLIDRLKYYEDYDLNIVCKVFTLDTIGEPEVINELGELVVNYIDFWNKEVILECKLPEDVVYRDDLGYLK